MDTLVLEFVSCCRVDGMRISTAEVLDCLDQLDLAGSCDERIFHTILKANFAKSRREQSEFDRLYQLFFHGMNKGQVTQGPAPECPGGDPGQEDPASSKDLSFDLADYIQKMEEAGQSGQTDLEQALMDFMRGRPQAFIEAVRKIHDQEIKASQAVKFNLGQLTGRLEIMLSINQMKQRMVQFLCSLDADVDTQGLEALAGRHLEKALVFLNQDSSPDNAGFKRPGAGDKRYPSLGQIPFSNLTHQERERVQEVIDQWVRKLEEISSLRFAAAKKGMVDVKKTIQKSSKYLGVPVEIVRKDRPLRKGKIVTLCDVSGSVWSTARFMLNILYSLQECFARVKSYIFIDQPLDVTGLFLAHDANRAVEKILKDTRLNYNAKTDYGLVFQTFRDEHLSDLDKKTTLIIMGDGRSNYFNPREPVLEALRERCRRVVWLNPEQERFWGTGDSEMKRYSLHCNEARACGNLNQLIEFIQDLVL
ncbi:MAG: VWA domain-containing protein [Desulfobacter sp.]|nr:VWA domain-containing protein [Desulfobacter sp.]WDP87721.1 MAG: VWA domain-containing protein [Desulfobacter sp.]